MAKFILGNRVRKLAVQRDWLSKSLWFLDFLLIGGIIKCLGLLPVDHASAAGRWLLARIGPLTGKKNDIIRSNLRHAFPDKSKAEIDTLVSRVWGGAGAVLLEFAHLHRLTDPANGRFQVDIRAPIDTYDNPQKPAIFVTAHVSNWELVASTITNFGVELICLYSPPNNPWLDQMLKKSRAALGCELLPRDVSMRPLVRAISEKRSVAMVVDRRVEGGELVPFFGCDKLSTTLPAKLALKHGCPLVPVEVKRLAGARFKVIFYPPVLPRRPDDTEDRQAFDMMAQVHGCFEQWIREAPGEWLCTKRIWPKEHNDSDGLLRTKPPTTGLR